MVDKDKILSIVEDQGFDDYKWIDPKEIIVANWVRVKCEFGCDGYGAGTCPPNTPSVADCREFFKEYESALLIRLKKYASKDSYPSDWSHEMTDKLLEAERLTFLSGYPKVFLLNQTCCTLCKKCSGSRKECNDKTRSRPSPESFAVDVYQTMEKLGMPLHVVSDNPSEMNRIAILLIN